MSIHSLTSLSNKYHYVNLINHAIKYFQRTLSPSAYKLWNALFEASYFNDGVFTGPNRLIASITNMSISTIIRSFKELMSFGLCIKINNYAENGRIKENTYELVVPDYILDVVKEAPLRDKPEIELEPDYSVQHDYIEDENCIENQEQTIELRDIPKDGDTRGLLTIETPKIGGIMGERLARIKSTLAQRNRGICQIDTALITILDQDINTNEKTEAAPIADLRQEEVNQDKKNPASIPPAVINKLRKIINSVPGISNPSGLVREAIHFVANRKEGYSEWHAVGAFRKLLGKNGCGSWSTPWGIRSIESNYNIGYENEAKK